MIDLPAVGENLADHIVSGVSFCLDDNSKDRQTLLMGASWWEQYVVGMFELIKYAIFRTGSDFYMAFIKKTYISANPLTSITYALVLTLNLSMKTIA